MAIFGIVPILHPLLQLSPASYLHRREPRAGRPELVGQSRIPSKGPGRFDRIGKQVENHLVIHRRAGYDGMTNMELRRKVGYRPRSRRAPKRATSHSARRSHASFLALGEDACAAAWEMDTVEGSRGDSARLLTLLHRPSRFQLALPLPDGTCASVLAALSSLRGVLGEDGARRAFGAVLTDNGSEFADEGAVAALLGERDGETRLFYCDPRQSQQKGACEKNHVEIRKLLPKGAGARFDRLTAADCALLMSQVNSEPRGALGFLTPARVLRMALGEDASALMDAFGIEELAPGELDLTPGCIERARAARGEGPLAG